MHLNMLRAKIHRATVTHAELHYEGSCAIDGTLLDRSGIREYEQIHIYNVNSGERFVTDAIRTDEGSRRARLTIRAHSCSAVDPVPRARARARVPMDRRAGLRARR